MALIGAIGGLLASGAAAGGGAAATGAGLLGTLGAVGSLAGGVGSLAGAGYGIYQSQALEKDPGPYYDWAQWKRARTPSNLMMRSMYYNPQYEGVQLPWTAKGRRGEVGNYLIHQFTPDTTTSNLFSHYLTRSYGLPEAIARSMSSAALAPLRSPNLPRGSYTAPQMRSMMQQPQSSALIQSALGAQQPQILRQLDYLNNAAQLAQFKEWRAAQLPRIIG